MKTFLPQNKFYSTASPNAVDEAGASALAPTPGAPVEISVEASGRSLVTEKAVIDSCQEPVAADALCISKAFGGEWCVGKCRDPKDCTAKPIPGAGAEPATSQADHDGEALGRTGDSISPTGAAGLLQRLGSLDGTDLIHEIFAAKPKHFKLKHKRRIALPRFAPDYEAMEVAMHDRNAPRVRADDPVWADEKPLFLKETEDWGVCVSPIFFTRGS